MNKYNIYYFIELFFHELDSWLSSDIACCDNCVDDFIKTWPAVYQRDLNFQKNNIPLSDFYSGSHLQSSFSIEEFNKYINEIKCPRCGSSLHENIWPYNLKFEPPEGFDDILYELAELANTTPFMLLNNDYAIQVYQEIKEISKATKKIYLNKKFYRGKPIEIGKIFNHSDFTAPSKNKTKEGRYNHYGCPVFYLASHYETCYYELGQPKQGICVSELTIDKPLKILDLMDELKIKDKLLQSMVWSSLVSSPNNGEGWYKPQYIFTRFIADCALYLGFDGIRYPSVRLGIGDNLVLFKEGMYGTNLNILRIFNYYGKPNPRV